MNVINFDNITNQFEDKTKHIENHFLAPQHPFRMGIIGGTGTGKTNILLNLLLKYIIFDKVYLYAKDLTEPKYIFMIEFFEKLRIRLEKKMKKKHKDKEVQVEPLLEIGNKIDDIINVDDLDKEKVNIIIFDDFVTEKDQDKIIDLFIRGRKKNCSIFYLSQSYFSIPKNVRLQMNYFIIFNIPSRKELIELSKDHATDVEHKEFIKIYQECTREPYSFLFIDNKSPACIKYRSGFDKIYIRNNIL